MQLFLYQAGDSWLHRRTVGTKFALLLLLSSALFTFDSLARLLVCLALALAALASTGLPWRRWVQALRWPLLAVALLSVLNALWLGTDHAIIVASRLSTALILATALTASTPIGAMLEALEGALLPFERRGLLHAQKIAFTLTLALTLVPVMVEQLRLTREAQVARGAGRSVRGLFTPVLVRVLKASEELTSAVEARGFPRPLVAGIRDEGSQASP
ncbi:MAG: energy-coupling factor transporter transmembrane protein EcfT [Pseudomonadota bacterium]